MRLLILLFKIRDGPFSGIYMLVYTFLKPLFDVESSIASGRTKEQGFLQITEVSFLKTAMAGFSAGKIDDSCKTPIPALASVSFVAVPVCLGVDFLFISGFMSEDSMSLFHEARFSLSLNMVSVHPQRYFPPPT